MDIESQVRCLSVILAEVIDAVDQVRQSISEVLDVHERQGRLFLEPFAEENRAPLRGLPRGHLEIARQALTDAVASLRAVRS